MMMTMQAAATLTTSCCAQKVSARAPGTSVVNSRVQFQKLAPLGPSVRFQSRPQTQLLRLRAEAQSSGEPSDEYVTYQGKTSVFPAEACEDTGEDCDAEGVFKEVSPKPSAATIPAEQKAGPDREYEEYSGAKTVFPGEACEELGGEFCEPEFQEGVYPEKASSKK